MWPAGGEQPMAMDRGPTASSASAATTTQHSPWQSLVPYLFGVLAAMLGLIALSLLALACSYWKLSGSLYAGEPDDADRQARHAGDGGKGAEAGKTGHAGDKWPEHVVVIMAGDERPTFLATPASGRADDSAAASFISGGSEQGRCVDCGARARPAGLEDDDARSSSERSAGSGNSVTS